MGMGASNSAVAASGCCGKRTVRVAFCRNDRLKAHLEQLNEQGKHFDSAWVYREEFTVAGTFLAGGGSGAAGQLVAREQYVLQFQRREKADANGVVDVRGGGAETQLPGVVRKVLRLDWGREGLSYLELDTRLPNDFLVQSKAFEPPLSPTELLEALEEVELTIFDAERWNSLHFCFHLVEGVGKGRVYDYR